MPECVCDSQNILSRFCANTERFGLESLEIEPAHSNTLDARARPLAWMGEQWKARALLG